MATNKNVNTSHTQPCNSYSIHRNTVINCCTKHAMLTQCCWTVCPGEDNESKSRCHKRHSTGKKKKKKKRRRRGEENSSDCDSEFVLKQRDSKCGQSLSPSRRVELPDIIPKQVKKKKKKITHTHTLFRIPISLYTESRIFRWIATAALLDLHLWSRTHSAMQPVWLL